MKAFFHELRRRKVFRTAVAYLATAFIALQVADLTFEPLGFSAAAYRVLIVTVAVGFPLALVLSWIFELRSERPLPAARGWPRLGAGAVIVVGALLIAGFAVMRWDQTGAALHTVSNSSVAGAARVRLSEATYENYVRARYHLNFNSEEHLDSAVVLLQRVLQDKPDFAGAHAALASTYMTLTAAARPADQDLAQRALVSSERALALDARIPEAHIVRGQMLWRPSSGFAHELAAAEYQHALALDPDNADARAQLGSVYTHIGLLDDALQQFGAALRVNPLDSRARTWIGQVNMYRGHDQAALASLRAAPASVFVGYQIAWALSRLGRAAEAQTALNEHIARFPDQAGVLVSMQALLAAKRGDKAGARRAIDEAQAGKQASVHYHHTAYNLGLAFAQLAQQDSAMYWLRAAANGGLPCYTLFRTDPDLVPLHAQPEFRALLADLQGNERRYRRALLSGKTGSFRH
jgi:tetratricopeptide (TPR) repeat protein